MVSILTFCMTTGDCHHKIYVSPRRKIALVLKRWHVFLLLVQTILTNSSNGEHLKTIKKLPVKVKVIRKASGGWPRLASDCTCSSTARDPMRPWRKMAGQLSSRLRAQASPSASPVLWLVRSVLELTGNTTARYLTSSPDINGLHQAENLLGRFFRIDDFLCGSFILLFMMTTQVLHRRKIRKIKSKSKLMTWEGGCLPCLLCLKWILIKDQLPVPSHFHISSPNWHILHYSLMWLP